MTRTAREVAQLVDHTILTPHATDEEVTAFVQEAPALGVWSVCVSPSRLPLNADLGEVRTAAVCGFPSGNHHSSVKAIEAALAVGHGADEIDMVVDLGLLRSDPDRAGADIACVRNAVHGALLKVILETAALTDEEIVTGCRLAEEAGADFVKTSTGFHPAGGASLQAVHLMHRTVGGRLGVKASGGIRDWKTANEMLDAGATRLGMSGTRSVLAAAQ